MSFQAFTLLNNNKSTVARKGLTVAAEVTQVWDCSVLAFCASKDIFFFLAQGIHHYLLAAQPQELLSSKKV